MPVGSNEAGAPRVYAIGRRVRVPTHILWQDSKAREQTVGSRKQGTQTELRRVYFDALLALNDRPTVRLTQLIGNGKLLLFKTRNVVSIESASFSISVGGGRVILTAGSTLDPDFTDKLAVGKAVQLSGFVVSTGADLNIGYWKVAAITGHTATPSTIELSPYSGQTVAGIAATSGTAFAPATVTRIDDVIFSEVSAPDPVPPSLPASQGYIRVVTSSTIGSAEDIFEVGQKVRLEGWSAFNDDNWVVRSRSPVFASPPNSVWIVRASGGPIGTVALTNAGSSNPGKVFASTQLPYASGFFPTNFNPDLYYHDGSDTQTADALLESVKGTANSPGYRGVACQGLDDFFVSQFGDQLPFALEALIDPDQVMDWGTALATILRDRAGIPNAAIDVSGIDPVPFLGFALRGPVEAQTALQPLLVAGQIVGQERDGKIALFNIHNADVVRIENGAEFSHMAARLDGEAPLDDKVQIEDEAEEDLPTSVGVRHQDPDNQYADGYQQFGLRNPRGVRHENRQEIDIGNMVLTRKDARNLAATTLRRAWINRRTFRMTLTAHYLHLLENDIVTWTDDDANEFTARIIQRDIGSDFRVAITAVEEDINLAVAGSPVQSAAGDPPPRLRSAAPAVRVVVIDAPAVDDSDTHEPHLAFAVCAEIGSPWTGAQLWESADAGVTWNIVGTINQQASIGVLTADLLTEASSEGVGIIPSVVSSNPVTVEWLSYGQSPLTEATDADAEKGANWFLIVHDDGSQEIASYQTLTYISGTEWSFDTCYRGLRGTFPYGATTGNAVVRLTPHGNAGIFLRKFQGAVNAQALKYRVVPFGASFDDAPDIDVTATWRNARPLPVRQVQRTTAASPPYDARLTVTANWTRRVLPIGTQPPHDVDELVEAYRFDIYDPTGVTLMRTKHLKAATGRLRDRWVDYPVAEQIADGYTPGAATTIRVAVAQVGEFGDGPSEAATL